MPRKTKSTFRQGNPRSDTYWLDSWAVRIEAWQASGDAPNEHAWIWFRPDSHANDAMIRLAARYPQIVAIVQEAYRAADTCFELFTLGNRSSAGFAECVDILARQIRVASHTISKAEQAKQRADKVITWQEVREKLEPMAKANAPYPGEVSLAKTLGCSQKTVNKAINHKTSAALRVWRNDWKRRKGGATTALDDITLDNAVQACEVQPDELADGDVDSILAKLLQQATNERERAGLQALDKDGRRRIALAYIEHSKDLLAG